MSKSEKTRQPSRLAASMDRARRRETAEKASSDGAADVVAELAGRLIREEALSQQDLMTFVRSGFADKKMKVSRRNEYQAIQTAYAVCRQLPRSANGRDRILAQCGDDLAPRSNVDWRARVLRMLIDYKTGPDGREAKSLVNRDLNVLRYLTHEDVTPRQVVAYLSAPGMGLDAASRKGRKLHQSRSEPEAPDPFAGPRVGQHRSRDVRPLAEPAAVTDDGPMAATARSLREKVFSAGIKGPFALVLLSREGEGLEIRHAMEIGSLPSAVVDGVWKWTANSLQARLRARLQGRPAGQQRSTKYP